MVKQNNLVASIRTNRLLERVYPQGESVFRGEVDEERAAFLQLPTFLGQWRSNPRDRCPFVEFDPPTPPLPRFLHTVFISTVVGA